MTGVGRDGDVHRLSPSRIDNRAFTLQFTTLILIVLSFIIGAFGADRLGPSRGALRPAVGEGRASTPLEERTPSDSIFIEHLFKPASVEVDRSKAFALAAVLKSHDIDAEVDIVPDSMGDGDYRLAERQAKALLAVLAEFGVQPSVYRLYILDSIVPEWAAGESADATRIRLYRTGGRHGAAP